MGNTVVWKPSPTQQLAAQYTMELLEAAGLPAGVINLVTGDGLAVSEVALNDREFGGLHFTGSTKTFKTLWRQTAENLDVYRSYPRSWARPAARTSSWRTPAPTRPPWSPRWSAARSSTRDRSAPRPRAPTSRAPCGSPGCGSSWPTSTGTITYGDVTDFSYFGGAVIDRRAFTKHSELFARVRAEGKVEILAGATADDSQGFFVQPTILVGEDPHHEIFTDEFFGPILAVHVYDDARYSEVLSWSTARRPMR